MKYYLFVLLVIIMGAGAHSMFEIAYQGMALEHGAAPNPETYFYIFLALWYVVMMVFNVLIIMNRKLRFRTLFIGLVSVGVFMPIGYVLLNGK